MQKSNHSKEKSPNLWNICTKWPKNEKEFKVKLNVQYLPLHCLCVWVFICKTPTFTPISAASYGTSC